SLLAPLTSSLLSPPPPPPTHTLLPYTTLFRSRGSRRPGRRWTSAASPSQRSRRRCGSGIGARRPPSRCGTGGTRSSSSRPAPSRSEEHTSELQSPYDLVCRLLLEKKNKNNFTL